MNGTYELGISMLTGLGQTMDGRVDYPKFLSIRKELNQFLLSLNYSNHAEGKGQQIHFLFMALDHLDNVEREIRISVDTEELVDTAKIHDKIRSLKMLILNYIKHLTDQE